MDVQSGGLQVSTSNSLTVIEEDRSGYQQSPARTIGDTSLLSHFAMIKNQFTDNIFEPALIDTAVDISSCDFNNNEENGNDASPRRCMYIDTTDLDIVFNGACADQVCISSDHVNTLELPKCISISPDMEHLLHPTLQMKMTDSFHDNDKYMTIDFNIPDQESLAIHSRVSSKIISNKLRQSSLVNLGT